MDRCPKCGYEPPLSDAGEDKIGLFAADAKETSRLAAIQLYPRSGTARLRVLEAVADISAEVAGGLTDYEIEQRTGMRHTTASARRNELVAGGWLVDTGKRRPTDTGSLAIVWSLSNKARTEMGLSTEPVQGVLL
jgi:hypothetical protein